MRSFLRIAPNLAPLRVCQSFPMAVQDEATGMANDTHANVRSRRVAWVGVARTCFVSSLPLSAAASRPARASVGIPHVPVLRQIGESADTPETVLQPRFPQELANGFRVPWGRSTADAS